MKPTKAQFTAVAPHPNRSDSVNATNVSAAKQPPVKPVLDFADVNSFGNFVDYLKNNICIEIAENPRAFKFIVAATAAAITSVVTIPSVGIASIGVGALGAVLEKVVADASKKVADRVKREEKEYKEYSKENSGDSQQNSQGKSIEPDKSPLNDVEISAIKANVLSALKEQSEKTSPAPAASAADFDMKAMATKDLSMEDLNAINKSFSIVDAFHKIAHDIGRFIAGKETQPVLHQGNKIPNTTVSEPRAEELRDKEERRSFQSGRG